MRKILIHSLVFSPDSVSTAYLYNDIALKFQKEGYEVVVFTTTPQYNIIESELKKQPLKRRFFGLFYESNFHGIRVKHVYQKKFKSTYLRMLGFIYWHLVTFFLGIFENNIDVILSPSPPLSIGFINILIGKIKGAKVIYNIQEIYPDLLIESGFKSKPMIYILKKLEQYIYKHSDAGITIDKVFYDTISLRYHDQSRLHIIPNFVDTDLFKPIEKNNLQLDEKLFPKTDTMKLMYAGNLGIAQDWEILVQLAENTKEQNIEYFIIGEGAMKSFLLKEKAKLKLDKLHILPYQKRELMPQLIAYSDLQLIFMTPEMDKNGLPSKVYTIMSCQKPLLVSSGENTPIVNFLKDLKCAKIVSQSNISERVTEMTQFIREVTPFELIEMGKHGVEIINKKYSKELITGEYIKLVNDLMQEKT